jgi:hypothetical protein
VLKHGSNVASHPLDAQPAIIQVRVHCTTPATTPVFSSTWVVYLHAVLHNASRDYELAIYHLLLPVCVRSHQHPVPQGRQLDYGVVLGYALHK